ncbi:MAG: hypothetical protein K9N35_03840 [Candidatus Marinimicrobia bacterium]|nr:hypothetical protein [Candidatus Neomarinimicrobiota bacterium]
MKRLINMLVITALMAGSVLAQFAEGQPALRAAIGPSFSYLLSFKLDETAFAALSGFTPNGDFDLGDPNNTSIINSEGMLVTGFEGFGEVTPHWTIGMYAGQGEYLASAQDAAKVDYLINFVVNQVGVTAEFNTHSRSRLKLLGGSLFGIGQATLKASSSAVNESWTEIFSGDSLRQAFELSTWTPVVQPYLGLRFDISRTMGFKLIAGWNEQVASAGSWKLYHTKTISDSPEVAFRALFFRSQIYVIL